MNNLWNAVFALLLLIAPVASATLGSNVNLRGSSEMPKKNKVESQRDLGLDPFAGGDDISFEDDDFFGYGHIFSNHENHDDARFQFEDDDDEWLSDMSGALALLGDSTVPLDIDEETLSSFFSFGEMQVQDSKHTPHHSSAGNEEDAVISSMGLSFWGWN